MLFPYQYLEEHPIYRLQQWMDDLFLNVWCTASPEVPYHIDLLPEEVKDITLQIYHNDRITTDYLYGPIQKVYELFQGFSPAVKTQLAAAYRQNNSIEDLCKQQNGCTPFLYKDMQAISKPLRETLEQFYKHLFTSVIHLGCVQEKIGRIDDHYDAFVRLNDEGKCPFCGLNIIKGADRTVRDAYDHYLPKHLYPFNSINFNNLAPMCHECNSPHKSTKDPIWDAATQKRRRAFYPYDAAGGYTIDIEVNFAHTDPRALAVQDVTLNITSATHQEEADTWKELFGIEERYKERCVMNTEGWYWFVQATEEYEGYFDAVKKVFSHKEHINKQIKDAGSNIHAAGNFLKIAYLNGWRKAGVLP